MLSCKPSSSYLITSLLWLGPVRSQHDSWGLISPPHPAHASLQCPATPCESTRYHHPAAAVHVTLMLPSDYSASTVAAFPRPMSLRANKPQFLDATSCRSSQGLTAELSHGPGQAPTPSQAANVAHGAQITLPAPAGGVHQDDSSATPGSSQPAPGSHAASSAAAHLTTTAQGQQ